VLPADTAAASAPSVRKQGSQAALLLLVQLDSVVLARKDASYQAKAALVLRSCRRMGERPASRMQALLDELCVKHGWCLKPDDRAALVATRARDRDDIVDAIIRAEHGEAHALERATPRWLAALVDDWLFDPRGRGAVSGLPL